MLFNYFDIVQQSKKKYNLELEPICRQFLLTRNELDILLFLFNNPELDRAADIVSCRGIAKSHVSLSVGTLEEKHLLQKASHLTDRRTIRLALTETGKQIAAQAACVQRHFFEALLHGVTQDELTIWLNIIEKVNQNIRRL